MAAASKEFWEDLRWGEKHHTELLPQYRDQWVAISNKEVVAAGENLAQVKQTARKKTGKEWVPVLFVDCGEHIYGTC